MFCPSISSGFCQIPDNAHQRRPGQSGGLTGCLGHLKNISNAQTRESSEFKSLNVGGALVVFAGVVWRWREKSKIVFVFVAVVSFHF